MVKRNHLVRHPFWPNEFDLRRERRLTQRPFGNRQIAIMKNSAGLRKKAGIDYQHDQEHEQDSLTPGAYGSNPALLLSYRRLPANGNGEARASSVGFRLITQV